MKGPGWVGLQRSIIFTLTVGRFDTRVTPYAGILTMTKLKYFIFTDLNTKTLKSCTTANNTRRHSEYETINIVCKV